MPSPVVSIAYHSGYGHTTVIAEAVHAGAVAAGAEAHLVKVDEITDEQWAILDASDAIVFGAPTYMGSASAAFHAFAESTNKRWAAQSWDGKVAAGFTNSGSKSGDKLHTLNYFQILAGQHGMHWVNLGLKPGWSLSTSSENELNRLGFFVGAAAQSAGDQGVEGIHKSDIATAEHLGRRVADTTKVFVQGSAATGA
ncbi:flavodoxin family protein [Streptomyces fuscichromogenes]|uniref:flavodoxin family protein n=1 Tax=Streptomyces fuscichromogenes TaxID=1324013 RepID=UPI0037F560CE